MKKLIPSYVRVPLLFAIVFMAMEYFIDSGSKPAFIEYPMVSIFLVVFLFLLVAIEIVMSAIDKVTYTLLSDEQRKQLEEAQSVSFIESDTFKRIMKKLTRTRNMDEEASIELEHDYDGIKELDNVLPPWWVGLFYASVVFAVIYMFRFHVFNDYDQKEEYEAEMAMAQKQVDLYNLKSPDVFDIENVTVLTDAADLATGKSIFENTCAACHRADGGGSIGPNLTDDQWILGGGIKNVFHPIMEGGRDGKGMVPWKATLKPDQIQKIASYVLSLKGTNPPDAKAAEGEKWVEEVTAAPETAGTVIDSTTAK